MNPVILTGMVLASMVIGSLTCAETSQDDYGLMRSCRKGATTSVALVYWTISIVVACGRFPSGYV